MLNDEERIYAVDRWLEDVSAASTRWKTAKSAEEESRAIVAYLEEIQSRMRGVPADLAERMSEAIAQNERNAELMTHEALRQSVLEGEFYTVLCQVEPPEVAEAWRMRCIEGKTWLQCSLALHYNRQHLERLSKRAKIAVYQAIPERYRRHP